MKLSRIIVLFVLLWACVLGCAAIDREAFNFTSYNLDVRVEPEQQRLAVRGKVTLRNDSPSPQRHLTLQISSSLDWRSIQLNGKPVQFVSQPYASDVDHTGALSEAVVTLPQEVAPHGTVELEIGYEGVMPLDVTRLTRIGVAEDVAKHTDWDQISASSTAVRGIGYVAWYPVSTEAASLSDGNTVFQTLGRWKRREAQAGMDLDLCVRQAQGPERRIIANGLTTGGGGIGSSEPHDSTQTITPVLTSCSHEVFRPLGETVPTFAMAQYAELNRPNVNINYLGDHKSAAENYPRKVLHFARAQMPFVSEWFGAPREKAEVVGIADPEAAPFESGTMLFTPSSISSDARLAQMTAVHQLTHAAFSSPRPWIYEGLAHFAQAVYRERQSGRQAALDFMGLHRTAVAEAEKSLANNSSPKSLSNNSSPNPAADESLINTSLQELYRSKAMFVWWMLRDMVGEAVLKKALSLYHADQDKDPAYLQRLIQAESKQDPDFRVGSVFPRQILGGGYMVTVTVENLGGAGAEVPVTLKIEGGEVTKRIVGPGKGKASVRIEAVTMPQEVVLNDGSVPESDMSNNMLKIEASEK